MRPEMIPLDSLTLDPQNVRIHPKRNLDAIKASLERFGQQKPIVVDADGVVVAGNGTVAAARELGWTDIHAVRTALKGDEARAFAIADNRTAELAEWDNEGLHAALLSLPDMTGLGFDEEAMEQLAAASVVPQSLERIGEPDAGDTLARHSRHRIGPHLLIVADPVRELSVWREHLTAEIDAVIPYPSCAVHRNSMVVGRRCLLLQPDGRFAWWLMESARLDGLECGDAA